MKRKLRKTPYGETTESPKVLKVTGWITPDNNFIDCKPWCHWEILSDNIEVLAIEEINHAVSEIESIKADCERLIEEGEHPEWHRYEMAQDGFNWKPILLKHGFIRVGSTGTDIHFEGTLEVLSNKRQFLKDFAEEYEMGAVFETQKGI